MGQASFPVKGLIPDGKLRKPSAKPVKNSRGNFTYFDGMPASPLWIRRSVDIVGLRKSVLMVPSHSHFLEISLAYTYQRLKRMALSIPARRSPSPTMQVEVEDNTSAVRRSSDLTRQVEVEDNTSAARRSSVLTRQVEVEDNTSAARRSPSPTRQVEVKDNTSAPMVLPPFQTDHGIGDPSDPALYWALAQSNSSIWYQPHVEGSSLGAYIPFNLPHSHDAFYGGQYINFMHENLAEQLVLEEGEADLQSTFLPNVDTASDPTSTPRHMQWDPPPHDGSMVFPQPDVQMTWLGPS